MTLPSPMPCKHETPVLVLDRLKMERNIARGCATALRPSGVTLRPHAKTNKSADVASRIGAPGTPITVSTLKEAGYFLDHGWRDILYRGRHRALKLPHVEDLVRRGAALTRAAGQRGGCPRARRVVSRARAQRAGADRDRYRRAPARASSRRTRRCSISPPHWGKDEARAPGSRGAHPCGRFPPLPFGRSHRSRSRAGARRRRPGGGTPARRWPMVRQW